MLGVRRTQLPIRRLAEPPEPRAGGDVVWMDEDGALRAVDEEGTDRAAGGGDTGDLEARVAAIEALGSLATDAELVAQVAAILGSADTSGDTLGELQALIGARLAKSANLSDLPNASTALTNLGVSAFAKSLLDDADAAAAQATLGITGAPPAAKLYAYQNFR